MIQGENGEKMFGNQKWKYYKNSQEYNTTLQSILADKSFMLPYFNEVLKRTKELLKLPAIKSIALIINDDFKESQEFSQIYSKSLMELILMMRSLIQEKKWMEREFLLAIRFAIICIQPYKEFTWGQEQKQCTDFHKFYENYDTIDEEQIHQEIMIRISKI